MWELMGQGLGNIGGGLNFPFLSFSYVYMGSCSSLSMREDAGIF